MCPSHLSIELIISNAELHVLSLTPKHLPDQDSDSDEEIVLALCMHEIHSASVANVALREKDLFRKRWDCDYLVDFNGSAGEFFRK